MHDSEFAYGSESGVTPALGTGSGVTPAPVLLLQPSAEAAPCSREVSSIVDSASSLPAVPCPATPPAMVEPPTKTFHVLYIFAGEPRKADIKAELKGIAAANSLVVSVEEVDICRGSGHDLLDDRIFNIYLYKIRQRHYDVVIVTPPCNTFSRARCNKGTGPPPIRSRDYPWGFPWLFLGTQR